MAAITEMKQRSADAGDDRNRAVVELHGVVDHPVRGQQAAHESHRHRGKHPDLPGLACVREQSADRYQTKADDEAEGGKGLSPGSTANATVAGVREETSQQEGYPGGIGLIAAVRAG